MNTVRDEKKRRIIEDLLRMVTVVDYAVNSEGNGQRVISDNRLQGRKIVFTGKLSQMTRQEAARMCQAFGTHLIRLMAIQPTCYPLSES